MYGKMKDFLASELKAIEEGGIYKRERIITSPQGANVQVSTGDNVVIM
ncbi:MAG TPA: glycine C-acetyltransferase, partial [Taishania sp.]|nr:glycine C-acetyltransferase [Taishania sp.]